MLGRQQWSNSVGQKGQGYGKQFRNWYCYSCRCKDNWSTTKKCYACGVWWNKSKNNQWSNYKEGQKTQWNYGPPGWLKERMEQALKEQEGEEKMDEGDEQEEEEEYQEVNPESN